MKFSTIIPTFLFVLHFINCTGQQKPKQVVREPVVAGTFYHSNKTELQKQLASFFETAQNKATDENIMAIIVPHAGYVFSGEVAASAFAQLDPDKEYSRIFVIGTSHHIMMNGASIYNRGNYRTPLGEVEVDIELANKLLENNKLFKFNSDAHNHEHSIEVQLPFLQYHLKKQFKIIPVIISTQTATTCRKIADILKPYFTEDNLFVISSDFAHYPKYADAVKTDKITANAIVSNSHEMFAETISNTGKIVPGLATSCCGWSSVLTLLCITSETPGIDIQHVKYMNSGDTKYGDKQRVVGYHSFVFTMKNSTAENNNFIFSPEDKKLLLDLARETIVSRLKNKDLQQPDETKLSEGIKTKCGAFVTLTKNDKLRGCIGRFVSTEPLFKVVQEMALSAAFEDRRFSPVKLSEMNEIEIGISLLTPLKPISSINEFELGKHGIYMIKNGQSGTFLPQVAHDTNWNKEEFLGHCASDKAGIGWDGWKDAQLFTYEALVFSEKELKTTGK